MTPSGTGGNVDHRARRCDAQRRALRRIDARHRWVGLLKDHVDTCGVGHVGAHWLHGAPEVITALYALLNA